jgi:hypothetical protein
MTDQDYSPAPDATVDTSPRQRAIEAYESARGRAVDTLGEAPLLALAGGIAAGALIAALLPRTDAEARLVRPTARRVKQTARAAFDAARDTGSQRLDEMGLNRQKGEQTVRSLLDNLTEAARASANAAVDAVRKRG